MRYSEILEACWTGYQQQGMKKKGNRQVPNCVPVEEVKIGPEITGKELLFKAAAQAMMAASQQGQSLDYEQAIRQASKMYGIPYQPSELPRLLAQRAEIDRQLDLLRQGKKVAKQRRQAKLAPTPADAEEYWKTHALPTDRIKPPAKSLEEQLEEDLRKWFKEKWVRFGPDGKIRGDCARGSSKEGKPKCLPQSKAQALGKKGRASSAAKKRREDPNPERRGPAKNVATKVNEENQDDRNARIIAGEIEDAVNQGNESLAQQKIKKLKQLGYYFDKQGQLQRMGMYEGAMKDLHTELADKYRELAPKIEKYKDSYLAGQLYNALEAIAIEHGAELELKRMMNSARNRAHMDYDTNPGGFQNWFWYLPFTDEPGMYEADVAEGWAKEISFTPDIITALQAQGYKGPYKLSQLKKWYKELNGFEGINADDDIMVQGNDIEYDGWVVPFGGKFLMGAERMVGPASAKEILKLDEKQDACYNKVKSRYKVWPSAYASGALVQCRKKGVANWGTGGKKK